ncbi:hypothetical protein TKK_0019290 [Trichogramma kaykai]|uniref:Nose resistant-to-fluoxetine protein N-terminal domain-containing protein n=1 Tax=Trichogramma kaykai TaxID=54128 RepID=A0ABD2VTZ5_9HYME
MCRRLKVLLFMTSFFTFVTHPTVAINSNHYEETFFNQDVVNALKLLSPRELVRNHNFNAAFTREKIKSNRTLCLEELIIMDESLLEGKMWALQMIDASSKLPSGILQGNFVDLGMFDECISVYDNSSEFEIRGRHCMYSIGITLGNFTLPMNPSLSICVPSQCSADDIAYLFNNTLQTISPSNHSMISLATTSCSIIDKTIWDTEFIVCLSLLVLFVGFLIACSVCDYIFSIRNSNQKRHLAKGIISSFSLQRNAASILSIKQNEGSLPAIHGIRFLSIAWIVLGHEFVLQAMSVNINELDIFEFIQSWKSLYLFMGPFAVDTFFVLSGFLMTYMFLKSIEKQKFFNIPMYYLHRFFRLTPAVVALLAISIAFIPKFTSSARWDSLIGLIVGNCRKNWWPTIIYVQNFVNVNDMCLPHLWYLAVDMQLFWISPIILYPLYKKPKIGLLILSGFIVASIITPAVIVSVNDYHPLSFGKETNITAIMEMFKHVYIVPYTRASPWLIGILAGYCLKNNMKIVKKSYVAIGWFLAVVAFVFVTYGTRTFTDPEYVYNPIWETTFNALSKPIWALAVCWVIYTCVNNQAGPVSHFLSWKYFMPLSRISYCLYLVHFVLEAIETFAERTPAYFSQINIWHYYLSDLIICTMIAFIFSLMFESPIVVLEKILLQPKSTYESHKDTVNGEEDEA